MLHMIVEEPSSLPTHMLVAKVVTVSQVIHEELVDPHILLPESSSYCMRRAGQLTVVFLMLMWATLMTPLTPHLSASSANDRPV